MADPNTPSETEPNGDATSDGGAAPTRSRWGLVLAIIIAVVLVGLMILLHLSGTVGPGAH